MRKFKYASYDGYQTVHVSDARTQEEHKDAISIYPDHPDVTVINFCGHFTQSDVRNFARERHLQLV